MAREKYCVGDDQGGALSASPHVLLMRRCNVALQVAIGFLKEVGMFLQEVSPQAKSLNGMSMKCGRRYLSGLAIASMVAWA